MSRNTVVPDGGWGWVIVLASLMFHLLMGLVFSSQSVLYLALQDEFGHGKGVTSWILSTFNAVMVFSGPLSASLGVKYGYKAVAFVGGLLLGVGFFLSFFANSIIYLTLVIGVIGGLGAGLVYVPVIAMCALYFDKKRSLAVGLGTSGFGVGNFAFPPFVALLEEMFTWRGVLLLVSGCLLHVCVLALLMRPLKQEAYPVNYDYEASDLLMKGECERECDDDEITLNSQTIPDLTIVSVKELNVSNNDCHNEMVKYGNGNPGDPNLSYVITGEILPSPIVEMCDSISKSNIRSSNTTINAAAEMMMRKKYLMPNEAERSRSHSFNYRSSTSLDKIRSKPNNIQHYRSAHEISKRHNSNLDIVNKCHKSSVNELSPQQREKSITNMSIMLMGSIYNIVAVDPKLNSMLSLNSKTTAKEIESHLDYVDYATSSPSIYQDEPPSSHNRIINTFHRLREALREYSDLMKNVKFSILVVVNILVNLTYLVPVLFIVDRAVDSGIDKDYAVLSLSLYGAGNICGRILTGVLADLPCSNPMSLYFVCIFFCGLITCLSVFSGSNLPLHNTYGFFFGVLIGGYVILTPLVLVDMLGIEMVGKSFGLCLLFQGIAMLMGTPLAGWIRDITGSYQVTFALFGSFMVFSALLIVPLIYYSMKGDNYDKPSNDETILPDSSP